MDENPNETTAPGTTRQLRPRTKPQSLHPGGPDIPQARRTSAQVRAEKERKEDKKAMDVVKTKAARVRVDELREALHCEQAESVLPAAPKKVGTTKKGGKRNPKTNRKASKPKASLASKETVQSPAEAATSDNHVSIRVF
jgi:hypothetical protein